MLLDVTVRTGEFVSSSRGPRGRFPPLVWCEACNRPIDVCVCRVACCGV